MTDSKTVVEDLAAWLTQIWDEEERLATDDLTPGPWTLEYECPKGEHDGDWDEVWIAGRGRSTVAGFNERHTCAPRDAAHVVRQQPSAVLARIAADRKILAACIEARDAAKEIREVFDGRNSERAKVERAGYGQTAYFADRVVRLLAESYTDRPDFPRSVERQGVEWT